MLPVTSSLGHLFAVVFVVTEKIVGFHTWKINKEILLSLLDVPFVQASETMLVSKQTLAWAAFPGELLSFTFISPLIKENAF